MDWNSYECTLDNLTLEKAKKELHENPEDRIAACKALLEWIESQSHIKCPDPDLAFLIMFLRGSKWSQLRAREMVEGYMTMKTDIPEWFDNIDTKEAKLVKILEAGYALPLPKRDPNGCQILLYRIGKLDAHFKEYAYVDTIRLGMVIGAYTSQSEMTQVNGSVFIMDFTGVTAKHLSAMMNRKDMDKFNKFWQKNVPGRFKAFHYYNAGLFFDTLMQFARPFLPKKYQERIKTHDNLESLYRDIPKELLPVEYLPDDHKGPNAGSVNDIIKNFKNEIFADTFRQKMLTRTSQLYGIDASKKTGASQVTESFRKLEVD